MVTPQTVHIIGAGIAGLTAAHELLERGFRVTLFEGRATVGGKAYSFTKPGSGTDGRKDYPAEHGFRFFLGWYHHLFDTLRRIPRPGGGSVMDNLERVSRWHVDEHVYEMSHVKLPFATPLAWIKAATICEARRAAEAEFTSWEDEVNAYSRGLDAEQIRLIKSMPKVLSSTKSTEASARSLMSVTSRSLAHPGVWILNAPTQEAFFEPWRRHLVARGAVFHTGARVQRIEVDGDRVSGLRLERDAPLATADYYICAVPADVFPSLCSDALRRLDPAFAGLGELMTDWQVGLQLYLAERLELGGGHFGLSRSPFALSGVQQSDAWPAFRGADHGDGRVRSVLSVIIADWHTPGVLFDKPARLCTRDEIIAEVIEQLQRFAPPALAPQFRAMRVLDSIVDPAVHLTGDERAHNETPLFMNTVGCYGRRPPSVLRVPNLLMAGDWTRTTTDIITMEGACESGRRAANGVLDHCQSAAERITLFTARHHAGMAGLQPMIELDQVLFARGLPHVIDLVAPATRDRLVREADRFLDSDRSWDRLLETGVGIYCEILDELQARFPDLPLAPRLPRRDPDARWPDDAPRPPAPSAEAFIERVRAWSGAQLRLVSDAPQQPPSHLDAYLDATNPIFEPLVYACSQKGKAHRLKYMMAIKEWLQTPEPIFHHLVEVLQVCHTASLMIDDIMDRTDLRRGEQTAHRRFGTARTLGAAYTGVLQALLSVYTHAGPGCLALAVEESARLHQGQTEELYFRDTATCPTEEQYLRMVENKTGGPFRLATRLLVALAPSEPTPDATARLLELSRLVGIFFQIRDDHLDLTSETYVQKKGVLGSDLDEGKYSFPLVRSIAQRPEMKPRVDALFARQPITDADRRALIAALHADGSLRESRQTLRRLAHDVETVVAQLAADFGRPGDGMRRWMDEMTREIPGWNDTDAPSQAG